MPIVSVLAIVIGAYVFLFQQNADVLYMAQLRSLFMDNADFFRKCMQEPGGLLSWGGLWFTQLFYHPHQGVIALTAIWIAIFFLLKLGFKIKNEWSGLILVPIACLMLSDIDLGYWVYVLKHKGYFFRESLGFLCVALFMLLYRLSELPFFTKRKYSVEIFDAVFALLVALTYPLIGYYAVMTISILVFRHLLKRRWISMATSILIGVALPLLFLQNYSTIATDRVFTAGLPVFQSEVDYSYPLSYPFIIAWIWLLLLCLVPKEPLKSIFVRYAPSILAICLSAFIVDNYKYDNENYHSEIHMYDAVDKQDWEKALDIIGGIKEDATREMVLMKNIAIFNRGNAGNEFFRYNNMGEKPYVRDSLRVHLAEVAGPMLHLHHGKINFAYRWAIENSVEFGYTIDNLKIMTQCAVINNEPELAQKYIDILSRTMNYKGWAERYQAWVDGRKKVEEYPELTRMRELYKLTSNRFDTDSGNIEMYLLDYFAHTLNSDSRYLQEMTLIYSMVYKDIANFWPHFFQYAEMHSKEEMPTHYQEAAYLFGILEPNGVDVSHMPFDQKTIKDRYLSFAKISQGYAASGLGNEEIGRKMYYEFGDTYWWFYFFCRGVKTY